MRITDSDGHPPGRPALAASIAFLYAIWAANFVVVKIALRFLAPLTLASFRVVLAGIFMVLLYPICRRIPAFASAIRARQAQPRSWRDVWIFIYLGFFGFAVNQLCFTVGLRYTSVSHSSLIVGLGPIYALTLAVLFRLEQATIRKVLGMLIALGGVVFMAGGPHAAQRSASIAGDAITLCGSLGFAMYAVLGKRVAARYDALTMTTYNSIVGALFVLPIAIRQVREIGPLANWRAITWQGWAGLFFMVFFSSVLAYLFYYWLLRYLEVSQLSTFSYLLPPAATILSIIFLGERGSWIELFGGALALSGVYFVESGKGK